LSAAPSGSIPAGFSGVNSHVWKKSSRSWPETRSASAMNSGVVTFPPARDRVHRRSRRKKSSSPIVVRSACSVIAPRV